MKSPGRWAVSDGIQEYATQYDDPKAKPPVAFKAPVAQPYIKLMAMYQASGQVHYTHEIPLPPNGLNAAFVQSRRALADHHSAKPKRSSPTSAAKPAEHSSKKFPHRRSITDRQMPSPQYFSRNGCRPPPSAVKCVKDVGQESLSYWRNETGGDRYCRVCHRRMCEHTHVDWGADRSRMEQPAAVVRSGKRNGQCFPYAPNSRLFRRYLEYDPTGKPVRSAEFQETSA